MLATDHRPVPLPQRPAAVPAQAATAGVGGRRQPLPGTAGWSRTWLDQAGLPQRSDFEVPIDAADRRTEHVRYVCPDKRLIEVTTRAKPGEPATVTNETCRQEQWALPGEPVRFCPDHGCQLAAGTEPAKALLPWAAIRKAVEPAARPLWLLAAELAAGIGVHAADVPVWAMLPAAPLLAGVGYTAVRGYLTRRAVKREQITWREWRSNAGRKMATIRRRARGGGYTGAAAGAWLATAAATDPATLPGMVVWGSLLLWWAVSAAPWWLRLESQRNRPVAADLPLPTVHAPGPDEIDAAEAARLWADGAGVANTMLDPATWRRIACGWQAVVVATKRGALNNLGDDAMKATIKRVAAAFDVPRSAITWIEEHDDNPNLALLLVQPTNPLEEGQIWPGPSSIRVTDSVIEADVGTLIDGSAMVETLFRFGWGAPSALSLGTTGGGKSARARKRLVIERWTSFVDPTTSQRKGLFLSFLHDPKRLESYAEFRNAVHGYGTSRDDAHIMVDAFLRECFRRYDMLASADWKDKKSRNRLGGIPFDPRVHGPIMSAYWDEFHRLAGDAEFVKKLETLARLQRACGMRSEVLSHMGTLGDTGSQALRDMVAGGRATLFRTTSGLNAALATGGQLIGDPRALPKVPGMCLSADGETATLMGRESYIPSDDTQHEHTLYDWLFDDDNQPIGYPAEIPPETAEAFGSEFMEWMAAGRRPEGRPQDVAGPVELRAVEDVRGAGDALRRILFEAGRPLQRMDIAKHPLWERFNVTSTLTAVFKRGQECAPPWLVRIPVGKGLYELAPWMREQMTAARDEERDHAA